MNLLIVYKNYFALLYNKSICTELFGVIAVALEFVGNSEHRQKSWFIL